MPADKDLVSRNEEVEIEAKKRYYKNVVIKRMKRLNVARRFAVVYIPIGELIFICTYWFLGLRQYNKLVIYGTSK